MPKGFFTLDLVEQERPNLLVPQCGACGMYKACHTPKMPYSGEGQKEILIVGESPGKTEDQRGIQFCGDSGQLLERTLRKFDVNMRKDCWITNALICRPSNNKIKNPKVIDYCRPNLITTIEKLKPKVIISLGGSAVKSLIGWIWKEDVDAISRWDGWKIPSQQLNAWICPTWHPAYILRTDYGSQKENEVRTLLFEKHLKGAVSKHNRPWKRVRSYLDEVVILLDPKEAAKRIRLLLSSSRTVVAFDYETDRLKPDRDDAEIYTCAISDGKQTFAYPWHGDAIKATGELLYSNVPKIGWNIKFEDRWTRKEFNRPVTNWIWDGMQAAHVLDNRPAITGLKFQAFVQLGVGSYDNYMKPYLQSKAPNEKNRIREADLQKILLYNGMDAILTWEVAQIQMKKLGYLQ